MGHHICNTCYRIMYIKIVIIPVRGWIKGKKQGLAIITVWCKIWTVENIDKSGLEKLLTSKKLMNAVFILSSS